MTKSMLAYQDEQHLVPMSAVDINLEVWHRVHERSHLMTRGRKMSSNLGNVGATDASSAGGARVSAEAISPASRSSIGNSD